MRYSVRMKRELANVKRGGTPSKWLVKRCLKHDELGRQVFPDLYPEPPKAWYELVNEHMKVHFSLVIKEQFEKQSLFYQKITGLAVPRGY